MNAEEYEHIEFWKKPEPFCKIVKKEFLKRLEKRQKAEDFTKRYGIDILKEINEKHGFSKN